MEHATGYDFRHSRIGGPRGARTWWAKKDCSDLADLHQRLAKPGLSAEVRRATLTRVAGLEKSLRAAADRLRDEGEEPSLVAQIADVLRRSAKLSGGRTSSAPRSSAGPRSVAKAPGRSGSSPSLAAARGRLAAAEAEVEADCRAARRRAESSARVERVLSQIG